MIRITTSDHTLAAARLATPALWEVLGSLVLLGGGNLAWPYADWAQQARTVLGRPECEPLTYLAARRSYLPDFFDISPAAPHSDLDSELDRLQDVEPAWVREHLRRSFGDDVPPSLARYAVDPAGALAKLADGYASYWKRSLAPVWPSVRDVLDAEVLRRGQAMARFGADGLFAGLGDNVRWRRPQLQLARRSHAEVDAGERALILVPLVFGSEAMFVGWNDLAVFVPYQARGAVRLADPQRDAGSLALLLGQGRAMVLQALVEPASTRLLAVRFGLAPSTISAHLAMLLRAGLVGRQRTGYRVYYQVNEKGRALLDLFG
jgi:DNA-binding transcriptional ArsR family regulator